MAWKITQQNSDDGIYGGKKMAWQKGGPAQSSGMRGSAPMQEPDTYDASPGEESADDSQHDPREIIADHVHGPDENGHHHLNLTTLAHAMHKKKGRQEQ